MWYDDTDSAWEFCNDNSGVPDVLSGGGGSSEWTNNSGNLTIEDDEGFGWSNSPTTQTTFEAGFFYDGTDTVNLGTASGTADVNLSANIYLAENGTESTPAFAFADQTNTGIYRRSTNVVGIVAGGEQEFEFFANAVRADSVGQYTWSSGETEAAAQDVGLARDSANNVVITDGFTGEGSLVERPDSDTIADSGDGNPATATLNPTSNLVLITCNDTDTCDVTMGETDTAERSVRIVNISANTVDFADTTGVSELAGAFAAGQYDSITLQYIGDRWVEISRSNN
jgi:hypothetical protein